MNVRMIVMVSVALIAAVGTALFARGWLNAKKAAMHGSPEGAANYVLVAKTNLPAGHFVTKRALRWQGWPEATLASSYVMRGKRKPDEFEGAVVRKGLVAGQPITDAMVVKPGDQGFLAAVLNPGYRAVSISVTATSGISGFVFPGDRVDMILTHSVKDGRNRIMASETVLQDVRVLAVDQKIEDQKNKAALAKTVTFEVTPKQAEKVSMLPRLGRISLSLRSLAREKAPNTKNDKTKIEVSELHVLKDEAKTAAGGGDDAAASLAPIGEARAAGDPVPLTPTARGKLPEGVADDEGAEAEMAATMPKLSDDDIRKGKAMAEAKKAQTKKAKPSRKADAPIKLDESVPPLPRSERAGVTTDVEVSRLIGASRGSRQRVLQIVRGDRVQNIPF